MTSDVKRLSGKKNLAIDEIFLLFVALISTAMFLINNRAIFSCSDSLGDFVLAYTEGYKLGLKRGFNFSFLRGKISIIFPLVIAFRFFICSTGNYWLLMALQYVPIIIDVWFLSRVISKYLGRRIGLTSIVFFFCFLQINIWHSLIICYPLDFMYGLFMAILAVYLFSLSLESKKKKLLTVISLICFYESLQAYESFIIFALVYFWIVVITCKEESVSKKIKSIVLKLIPYALVAVIYIVMMYVIKNFIYTVSSEVFTSASDGYGTVGGFFKTLWVFSFSMFPLSELYYLARVHLFSELMANRDSYSVFYGFFFAVAGCFIGYSLFFKNEEIDKKLEKRIWGIGISGLIIALLFPMVHAMMKMFQSWVSDSNQRGYVPSTISYFGWVVFLVCALVSLLNQVSKKNKIVAVMLCVAGFGIGGYVTDVINNAFDATNGPSSPVVSYQAQEYFELITNDKFKNDAPDVLYLQNYYGIHNTLYYDSILTNYCAQKEIHLTNNYDDVINRKNNGEDIAAFYYVGNNVALYIRDINNPGRGVYAVSLNGGELEFISGNKIQLPKDTFEQLNLDFNWETYNTDRVLYDEYLK